jgi:tetratricopeptide (TPR) repeat protein
MRRLLAVVLLAACASTTPSPVPTANVPPVPPLAPETQANREEELAAARATYEQNRNDAQAIIWLGRRTAYLGRYPEAIEIFTEGIRKHPRDARMYRHRGHRWISLRQFAKAEKDLERGVELVRGKPDQIEPDGLPNARNIPTSTLQSNLWYHLGLARYLQADFEGALQAYRECLRVAKNPDHLVSTSHWLYATLRRLNQREEAERVADAIGHDLDVIENEAYHKLLLMYRGEIAPEELARQDPDTTDGATILYGIGNWYLVNGQPEQARPVFARIVAGKQPFAFGYIAAEADLIRLDR